MSLSKALRHAFKPPLDAGEFDDLMEALETNDNNVKAVVDKATKLDSDLCLNCGPYRSRLRAPRLAAYQARA